MPCTWTGYGEPLPRLPINTGESTETKGGDDFLRKRGTNRGGNFGEGEGGRNRRKEAETGGQNNFREGEKYYRRGDGRF